MSIAFTIYENLHPESCPWIIDSGATDHMSPNASLFEDYRVLKDSHLVFTANGGILKVAGMGNIQIKGVLLRRVLHVPRLKTNLLSLQRLIDDTGWRFLLDSSQCVLSVKETGERILFARRKGGLLLLDGGVEKRFKGGFSTHSRRRALFYATGDWDIHHFTSSNKCTQICLNIWIFKI